MFGLILPSLWQKDTNGEKRNGRSNFIYLTQTHLLRKLTIDFAQLLSHCSKHTT